MKILLCHSDPELPSRESIDLWRIIRPFKELAKHVDWQIDHQGYPIDPDLQDDTGQVHTDKLVGEILKLSQYDIVWSGYFPDATLFDVMMFVQEKYGTKFVLDMDDDIYHLPEDNSFWQSGGIKGVQELRYMIANTSYMVTSTKNLKAEFEKHRKLKTYLFPNYIGGYKHKKFDNGDKVVIGYFGSVTHKKDLSETGFIEALHQIMHKYKNVHVGTVGANIEAYLPKQRYEHHKGIPGRAWVDEVWPNINCDIAVAPLQDTQFNRCKTNIKWLETAMIPAAFVGSNIEPYKGSVTEGETGLLVNNDSESWYEALESLVLDKELRQRLAKNAMAEVKKNWSVSSNWEALKDIVDDVAESW